MSNTNQSILSSTLIDLTGLRLFWDKMKNFVSNFAYSKNEIDDKVNNYFIGTLEEYTAEYSAGNIKNGSIIIITEDSIITDDFKTAVLGKAIIGRMTL